MGEGDLLSSIQKVLKNHGNGKGTFIKSLKCWNYKSSGCRRMGGRMISKPSLFYVLLN